MAVSAAAGPPGTVPASAGRSAATASTVPAEPIASGVCGKQPLPRPFDTILAASLNQTGKEVADALGKPANHAKADHADIKDDPKEIATPEAAQALAVALSGLAACGSGARNAPSATPDGASGDRRSLPLPIGATTARRRSPAAVESTHGGSRDVSTHPARARAETGEANDRDDRAGHPVTDVADGAGVTIVPTEGGASVVGLGDPGAGAGPLAAARSADLAITHHLDLARDTDWLNQLAHDIAHGADVNGHLRFTLAPEHLGRMTVELASAADGTAIRLTTETRQAHRIVAEAQPRLVAEARAQGLRVSDTQVDLDRPPQGDRNQRFGNQNSGGGGQPRPRHRWDGPDASALPAAARASGDDELYA